MQDATPLPSLRIPLRRPPGEAARRSAGAALVLSAGVHVLALLLGLAARNGRESDGAASGQRPPSAVHVAYVDVGAWPDADADADADAAPVRPPAAAVPPPSARGVDTNDGSRPAASAGTRVAADSGGTVVRVDAPGGDAGAGQGAPSASGAPGPSAAAGRARLTGELDQELDPRLVVPRRPVTARAARGDEAYLAQFHAALRAFNDSIQDQADRDRRAASWTWTDPEGRVWGFRHGVLMIAGQGTVNVEMQGERDQELLARQQARARREGQTQAERIERDRYLQERGRAIRDRRDRERAPEP